MRLILILLILLVVVAGAWFGALNATSTPLDFHFFRLEAPIGFALLASLLLGWLLGGTTLWIGRMRSGERQGPKPARSPASALFPLSRPDDSA